jgi:hypothetical protein
MTISDGAIERGVPADWPDGSKRVALNVGWRTSGTTLIRTPAQQLTLPITLGKLERASGGLPDWGGSGQIGKWNDDCGVDIWLGPHASAADRSAVLSALQAIKQDH